MSFKNALKNLVAHFGTVWALLLYMLIFAAIITGLSLPFVLPVIRAMENADVFYDISAAFSSLFGDGVHAFIDGLYAAYEAAASVFESNGRVAALSVAFVIAVVIVGFRFFLGLYEIPLATVLDGRMSCNAHYWLGGKFFSTLGVSVRYSLFKMLYTVLSDCVLFAILYGLRAAIGMRLPLLFAAIFVIIVFVAFRFSVSACWAPIVASGEKGVVSGFVAAARLCFKNFGTFYSTYLVSLILVVALGMFITIFTLGVGLVIVLPIAVAYFGYLNTTEFYNKTGKRYYVDGVVFTPPMQIVPQSEELQ